MTAEPGQAAKSPVAVLTQGGSNSLKGGDGDAAAVVAVGVADERIKKKRQSLSDVFTIVGYFHYGDGRFSVPKMKKAKGLVVVMLTLNVMANRLQPVLLSSQTDVSIHFTGMLLVLMEKPDQNNLMTMSNVLFKKEYPAQYTSVVSTRVSNSLLVGAILGQLTIGLTCDYLGRKTAIILTTMLIVVGGILATAAHGATIDGMFWMLLVARGIVGFGVGKISTSMLFRQIFKYWCSM